MGLTIDELAMALRLAVDEPVEQAIRSILQRLLLAAEAEVEAYAPGAPDATKDGAIIQICRFLYSSPDTALNNAPRLTP